MSRLLTPEDFAPHVGKTFRPGAQHRSLTLVAIKTPHSRTSASLRRHPFALLFEGPAGDTLPEGSYDVAVDGGAEFALYITPVHTASRDRQDYQAAFN